MELGQVVYSKAGRDSGRYFVIVEVVDENTVKIADGDLRRIKNAKIKNIKHLQTNGDILPKIAEKLKSGVQIFDVELNKAIRFYGEEKN